MNHTGTFSIGRCLSSVALAVLCLAGAALAAFIAWFFISDMIGDWYEVNSPEVTELGQRMPSYWAEHNSLSTIIGFAVWFSPSLILFILAIRFGFRACSPSTLPTPGAHHSKKIA